MRINFNVFNVRAKCASLCNYNNTLLVLSLSQKLNDYLIDTVTMPLCQLTDAFVYCTIVCSQQLFIEYKYTALRADEIILVIPRDACDNRARCVWPILLKFRNYTLVRTITARN